MSYQERLWIVWKLQHNRFPASKLTMLTTDLQDTQLKERAEFWIGAAGMAIDPPSIDGLLGSLGVFSGGYLRSGQAYSGEQGSCCWGSLITRVKKTIK